MAVDMSEVVGQENMTPEAKETVMDLLRSLPLPISEIKHAFFSWARQSGYKPTARDAAMMGVRKKRKPK
jgi:uncharacterized protein (DUF305 family)